MWNPQIQRADCVRSFREVNYRDKMFNEVTLKFRLTPHDIRNGGFA